MPSVVVVRDALAVDVATAVIGLASVDAVPARSPEFELILIPRNELPEAPFSVNVVVDGTVATV